MELQGRELCPGLAGGREFRELGLADQMPKSPVVHQHLSHPKDRQLWSLRLSSRGMPAALGYTERTGQGSFTRKLGPGEMREQEAQIQAPPGLPKVSKPQKEWPQEHPQLPSPPLLNQPSPHLHMKCRLSLRLPQAPCGPAGF